MASHPGMRWINFVDESLALGRINTDREKPSGILPLTGEQTEEYYNDLIKNCHQTLDSHELIEVSSDDDADLVIVPTKKKQYSDIEVVFEKKSNKLKSKQVLCGRFWCKICKVKYDSHVSHENSIAHQFNVSIAKGEDLSKHDFYIPSFNKGYQMMLCQGWDSKSGLGPSKSGKKFPIKTVCKVDREGLGLRKEIARISHTFDSVRNAALEPLQEAKSKKGKLKPKQLMTLEKLKESLIKKSLYES